MLPNIKRERERERERGERGALGGTSLFSPSSLSLSLLFLIFIRLFKKPAELSFAVKWDGGRGIIKWGWGPADLLWPLITQALQKLVQQHKAFEGAKKLLGQVLDPSHVCLFDLGDLQTYSSDLILATMEMCRSCVFGFLYVSSFFHDLCLN